MKLDDLTPYDLSPQVVNFDKLNIEPEIPLTFWQKLVRSRWVSVMKSLMTNHAGEPKVYHRRDRQGHSYLEVYDPVTKQTHAFDTAHEVRVWLEQRYYR